jgi:hypothetical protein
MTVEARTVWERKCCLIMLRLTKNPLAAPALLLAKGSVAFDD